jgi:hypothetical protein
VGSKRGTGLVRIKLWHLPVRLVTGAFILNSGISKQGTDAETASQLYGLTAGTYPPVRGMTPDRFVRLVSAGEILLGTALLVPVVPAAVAGAGLAAFSAGLLGLYARTPGMREPGSIRPTQQGTALAKDVWMFGIGAALVVDDVVDRVRG